MIPVVFGIALWVLFGFMLAFAIAPRLNHSVSPTPNEDTMTDANSNEYPHLIAYENRLHIDDATLDAFCSGYARALLWADAYREVDGELEQDENAEYAYETPGRWWEGMGIDFTNAVSFLLENIGTLLYLTTYPGGDHPNNSDFWARHGHDFLLTRNDHGSGFWNRGYPLEVAITLTDSAHSYGDHQVLTDDSPRVVTL